MLEYAVMTYGGQCPRDRDGVLLARGHGSGKGTLSTKVGRDSWGLFYALTFPVSNWHLGWGIIIYTHAHTWKHTHAYRYMHTCTWKHECIHVHVYISIHAHTYAHAHAHVYTCIHAYIYTHLGVCAECVSCVQIST